MTYAFRVVLPRERVAVAIRGAANDRLLIVPALTGNRVALTGAVLLRVLVTHPLLTLKVISPFIARAANVAKRVPATCAAQHTGQSDHHRADGKFP
jgi:uncharacterized protein